MTKHVDQVGGDHYSKGFGHWDVCELEHIAYLEGNATRYVGRWRLKGKPAEDLAKAISYLDKMDGRASRRTASHAHMERWFEAVDMEWQDRAICMLIIGAGLGQPAHIAEARARLQLMLDELEKRK